MPHLSLKGPRLLDRCWIEQPGRGRVRLGPAASVQNRPTERAAKIGHHLTGGLRRSIRVVENRRLLART